MGMATTLQGARRVYITPMWMLVGTWVLLLPMIYFAVDGIFTFDSNLVRTQSGYYQSTLLSTRSLSDRLERVGVSMIFLPIIFYYLYKNGSKVMRACVEERILLLMPIWAIITVIWSQSPQNTVYYGLNLVLMTLFAFFLARTFEPERLLRFFIFCGFVFMVLNILTAVFIPFYGTSHSVMGGVPSMQGITASKNLCGDVTVFFIAPALFTKLQGGTANIRRWLYIILGLIEIALTQSRTSWILATLLFGFAALYLTLNKFQTRDAAALALFVAMVISLVGFGIYANYETILLLMGKNATLTGRTQIWAAVMISVLKHPIRGWGYHGFWTGLHGESSNIALRVNWNPGAAHSGYLDTWLEVGGIGLALVAWSFVRAVRDASVVLSNNRATYLGFYISILFMTAVVNIDESTLLSASNLCWMFYLLACMGLRFEAREVMRGRYEASTSQ